LVVACVAIAAPASAQDMNISLSRLRDCTEPGSPCRQDDDAYRRVMTDFAGAMLPAMLTPAGTRGMRAIYVGIETSVTAIDSGADSSWYRAVEGDGMDGDTSRSRFVDDVLVWTRVNVRKGLPWGFELGTSISYLANTTYWALGAELRWALFEGFRDGIGWIPDLAVRGAVQTLVGDGEFNVTVPSIDVILSEPFVVASTVEIVPWVAGQVAFPFVDSELVDLTPETSGFTDCNPDPRTPGSDSGPPPYCRGGGGDLNNNVVFPSLRSMRWRLGAGLQVRYEWLTFLGAFSFDLVKPGDPAADESLPSDIDRQWRVDLGVGATL
jgi:hypothetical protein